MFFMLKRSVRTYGRNPGENVWIRNAQGAVGVPLQPTVKPSMLSARQYIKYKNKSATPLPPWSREVNLVKQLAWSDLRGAACVAAWSAGVLVKDTAG